MKRRKTKDCESQKDEMMRNLFREGRLQSISTDEIKMRGKENVGAKRQIRKDIFESLDLGPLSRPVPILLREVEKDHLEEESFSKYGIVD